MRKPLVAISTPWLQPGGAAHQSLTAAGFEVRHVTTIDADPTVLATAEAAIVGLETVSEEILAAAPHLRVIARTGVGYSNVDVEAASARGIYVCTTPGANHQSVAELTVALILDLARHVPRVAQAMKSDQWVQQVGIELFEKTVGIVGFGAVGRTVAELCQAFGMRVLAYDPFVADQAFVDARVQSCQLEKLLADSDFVTLHMPLSDHTRGLIGAAELELMQPQAYLINTARGGIVDEEALLHALNEKQIAGAALDTFATEPPAKNNPLVGHPNVVATPHIAGSTTEARARSGALAVDSVISYFTGGTPPRCVNTAQLSRNVD